MTPNPNRIEEGDHVVIGFTTEGGHVRGVVLHVPCANGDSWIIRDEDEQIIYVNSFESMLLKRKKAARRD